MKRVGCLADVHFLILAPSVKISTAWAYGKLQARPTRAKHEETSSRSLEKLVERARAGAWGRVLFNSFDETVCREVSAVAAARDLLRKAGAEACLVSGSGSSVFAVFNARDEQQRVLSRLGPLPEGWQVFPAHAVERGQEIS